MLKNESESGFTLIELLVVISIIGLLSSIVLYNVQRARFKAEDTKAITDMNTLAKAIDLYYQDNGQYPGATLAVSSFYYIPAQSPEWNTVLGAALAPYLPIMPKAYTNFSYTYTVTNSNSVLSDDVYIYQLGLGGGCFWQFKKRAFYLYVPLHFPEDNPYRGIFLPSPSYDQNYVWALNSRLLGC